MRMTKKELASICSLLIAGVAFGDVSESFDSTFDKTQWTNAGDPVASNYVYAASAIGYPITGGNGVGNKILPIDDSVTYAPASAQSGAVLLDMMVQASVPDDALEFPEGNENVQIAVGVSPQSKLQVWCMPKGGSAAAWCDLMSVEDESWHRVTLVFDYSAGYAQVRVDGEPKMTNKGYLTANSENTAETADGAWYKLAASSISSLTSVQVVGSTGIDDFVIKSGSATEVATAAPVEGTTGGIANKWFDKYGLGWDALKTYDDSGLTLAQKYEAGLNPLNGDKLEIKAMTMTSTQATFTIPQTDPAPGKAVQLFSATSSDFTAGKDVAGTPVNGTTVTLDLPDAGAPVKYYRLETVDVSTGN